jgi:hypothetical protein
MVRHWKGQVSFVVKSARNHSYCPAGYDFPNKNDTASYLISSRPLDIKPKIDFVEIAMEWKTNAKDSRVQETKSNQANECLTFPETHLCSGWNVPK